MLEVRNLMARIWKWVGTNNLLIEFSFFRWLMLSVFVIIEDQELPLFT